MPWSLSTERQGCFVMRNSRQTSDRSVSDLLSDTEIEGGPRWRAIVVFFE